MITGRPPTEQGEQARTWRRKAEKMAGATMCGHCRVAYSRQIVPGYLLSGEWRTFAALRFMCGHRRCCLRVKLMARWRIRANGRVSLALYSGNYGLYRCQRVLHLRKLLNLQQFSKREVFSEGLFPFVLRSCLDTSSSRHASKFHYALNLSHSERFRSLGTQ